MGSSARDMAYAHRYRVDSEVKEGIQAELEQVETMRYIQASIDMLTGGCEICKNAEGLFCVVHKHPVKAGDARCDDFVRRLPEDPRKASRAQSEQFISETLCLSKKNLRRFTGEP